MSTPTAHVAVKDKGQVDKPVEPTAISSPGEVSAHGVGEVLKTLVHFSMGFPTEDSTNEAVRAIEKWQGQPAGMDRDGARAPVEDVSQRVPPGYGGPPAVVGQEIDYDKLAAAIVKAQAKA